MLSTSSVREMPTKTTRYYIIPTRVAKIKKQTIIVQQLLKKFKLPYDLASLLQGKYHENLKRMSTQSLAILT